MLNVLLPFFGLIAAGFAAGRFRLVTPVSLAGLESFAVWVALPVLYFHLIATAPAGSIPGWGFVVATVFATYCTFAIAFSIGALVNGGRLIQPTFLKRSREEADQLGKQVIKPSTSEQIRYLMRLNVEKGTARKADVPGYYVGGKTGTSEKVVGGRYSKNKVLTSFTAILPADKPRYLLLIMLDEPEGSAETHGFRTSGWNAVPTGAAVISRIAPLLDIPPRFDMPKADQLLLVSAKDTR